MANAQAGTAYISVDGKSIRVAAEATWKVSGEKREALSGMDGVHGYKVTPDAGFIKFQFRDASDLNVKALNDITSSTVQMELLNGKTIIARNAWRDGELLEVKADDGTCEITFASADVSEQ